MYFFFFFKRFIKLTFDCPDDENIRVIVIIEGNMISKCDLWPHIRNKNLVDSNHFWKRGTTINITCDPSFNADLQTYERRWYKKLQNLYDGLNIISYVRSKRLKRFGHVWRAAGQLAKEVLDKKINRKRPLGSLRTRRVDIVARDIASEK